MRLYRILVLVVAVAGGAAAAVMPLPASQAASRPGGSAEVRPAALPPVPSGAVRLGAVSPQSVLHLEVTLRVRRPAALTAFIAALSDRRSPLFHRFLRRGQFAARFGPTSAQIATVEADLRSDGLAVAGVDSDRMAITVTGSAAGVERAFGTTIVRYRLPGGRVAVTTTSAPRVPAAAVPVVDGVLGLSSLYLPHSELARAEHPHARRSRLPARMRLMRPAAAGPQPCAAASDAATTAGSYTADQLASYYAITPLYRLGDLGQGVRVALAEFEPDSPADVSAYAACYGLHTSVSYVQVDGGAGTGTGSGEAALDIEDVMGLAPGVAIDVYQAPNSGTGSYDLYSAIVGADADQVVSTSWGLCELDSDPSLITSEDTLFAQAATQGQTVFAAAGDYGSTACLPDGTVNDSSLSVSDPASQPYVLGVGGTSVGSTSENVWNDSSVSAGAAGGGVSAAWCMPSYQDEAAIPGLIGSYSQTASSCGTAVPYVRQVPDVSADADPYTGYVIYLAGQWQGGWGGTSAAAPLWAAVAALTDASPYCADYGSGAAGMQPAGLYQMAATDQSYIYSPPPEGFYDVTSGNNDYTPSGYTGGLYPATTGYDLASGLGTPLATGFDGAGKPSLFYPGLTALMCWEYGLKLDTTTVTRIAPALGPSARSATVTITGTGFLPVTGADLAYIGSRQIPATCTSTTRCTVKLPPMRPGTVSIQVSAEDFTLSKADAASHYRYVAAPAISSLSPSRGTTRGRNTITIRGSDFLGTITVRFGTRRATRIRVISATKILATVPAGTGTVTVTVTAAGGTSPRSRASQYRYT
jgi:hypothetical protein